MMTETEFAEYLAAGVARFHATRAAVPAMQVGQTYATGEGDTLTVASVRDIGSGAKSVVLSSDGVGVVADWHEGASDSATWARYERWTVEGRMAHGYVDATTRKITQTG